ncbi:Thiamin pyrophosphokinase [Cynara cardunculus var. scolymus]|uniref:Thiamine pyrophosphokinase n=1 Tax=Cynara cardunculus var. scolymus TaxID=59895 RepID=A0A103XPC9_CYNCS|nr:Thiamin pyrophosphokinase [Cynara cardunculus var. scolymus]
MAEKLLMTHCSSFLLPPPFTNGKNSSSPTTYALIILNQHLPRFSPLLWDHGNLYSAAKIRLCADGGANRLFDNMPELFPLEDNASLIRERYKPDVIKGDMDSIRPDVLSFYKDLGTEIVNNSDDQDTTDLHKCITYVRDFVSDEDKPNVSRIHFATSNPISKEGYIGFVCLVELLHFANLNTCVFFSGLQLCILVAGALGGRFDHEMGNVNTLCHFSTTRIILLSDDCLIQLLPSSQRHEIHIQSSVEGPHCGLIPIGAPSGSSTTTGLQWDLDDTEMRFGGLVSTSNIVNGEIVTVRSDSDLLWTISLKKQP